ncbi:Hypothetical protein CINCED_3A000951 [Cinara cedri]|uniref:Uncharacterized protein n=1 Tax=Cinara cedri TaxID=506608 RepID=A0A5E4NJP9_9HEMI|nr:Hypothetical protein CINCED_3A000951 [Cinara cedri]
MEKTPSREQALVFNSIDGKIVSPKNIIFISRISNNRFCVFLSSKQILDNLIQITQSININDHTIPICRLLNPAKRFIISNVCPSIPNQAIIDALKNIDILPISQINHLKAGINIEEYEHIMNFRRQLFLKHKDIPKLPNSCKNNTDDKPIKILLPNLVKSNQLVDTNVDHSESIESVLPPISSSLDTSLEKTETDWNEDIETKFFLSTLNFLNETQSRILNETHKRPMSVSFIVV